MGSIRRHGRFRVTACRFLLCLAFVCSGGRTLLPAQNAGTPLSLEIKNAEAAIALPAPETSPAQKENALIRLARLCQLSGDLEAASKHWLQAAAVEQGSQNSNSLAAGAFCLAAIGEWEQARTAIAPLLQNGAQNTAYSRAHYLNACAQVWLNQDASRLRAMADDPAYGNLRSAVYYTLWKISGEKTEIKASGTAVEWELRLLSEFPRSPESRIIAPEESQEGEARARFRPSPLWLFLPGLGNTPGEEIAAAPPPASPSAPVPPPPPL
ncbi:MAG TPA: hypothetical protein DEQ14_11810, partial [Treponema sp.]|nr:hypothetical protein [Treponema sp.]